MGWRSRSVLLLAGMGSISTLLYLLNFRLAPLLHHLGMIDPKGGDLAAYPALFFSLFALYGLALVGVLRKRSGPSHLGLILGFALLFRVALLFSPLVLSSDIYRYVWDGRVQVAGINPYLYPPSAQELTVLRDEQIFPHVNRPEARTIYPPGAQMFFALNAILFPDSTTAMKAIMMLFDIGTLFLILTLLKKTGFRSDRVLLYAWSPLVLFELAGSGHIEAVMLPFVLFALLARMDGKPALAGATLGIATLIKLYPAALFPALYTRRDRRFPLAFGATILFGYLPYIYGAQGKVVGFLPDYFGRWEDFNVGLRYFLTLALTSVTTSPRLVAMLVLTALLGTVALYVSRTGEERDIPWRAYIMVSAYLLLLPTSFHPWYLVWILPFLCFYPSWGWLYLSGAITLSYLKYVQEPGIFPLGIRLLEFLPFYVLLGMEAVRHRYTEARADKIMTFMMEKSP
ncbi:MAG: glycosyltransferase 87 family protein [Candidatus Methylomirabilales bacterium]